MPKFYGHLSVGVLIGSNVPSAMQPLEVIPSVGGSPYAVRLQHSWTIYGPMQMEIKGDTVTSNRIEIKQHQNLREAVVNFFENEYAQKTDEEGSNERGASLEDEKFMQTISDGMKHDGSRFSTPLPLRNRDVNPRTVNLKQ